MQIVYELSRMFVCQCLYGFKFQYNLAVYNKVREVFSFTGFRMNRVMKSPVKEALEAVLPPLSHNTSFRFCPHSGVGSQRIVCVGLLPDLSPWSCPSCLVVAGSIFKVPCTKFGQTSDSRERYNAAGCEALY